MKLFLSFFLLCSMSVFGAVPDYRSFRGAGGIIVVTNPPTGTIVIDGSGVVSSGTNSAIGTYTNGTAVSMAATNNNFTAGNNMVLKGTNIGSTAHINYGMASNLTFNSSSATFVLGNWGDIFGLSNATAGGFAWNIEEPDLGNELRFGAGILVPGTVLASNVSLTSLLGSGNIMAITGGGVPYRTNLSTVDTNIGVGQTLYLDKSFGVDATASRTNLVRPFQTPSNSVAAILSGDTLVVRGGAYPINPKADPVNEPSFVNYSAGVAISNKSNIRIVGEPGAVWYMSAWRSNGYGFSMPMMWLQNCSNVVIDGMTFIGSRTNATNFGYGGLVLNGCDEVTVKNCTFSNWQNHAIVAQSASTVNSRLRFWNNTFADCGGTNHVTLTMDGTAINVEASNFEAVGNRFYRNLRNIEFCCDSDVRKVLIELNTSEGCYFDDIVLHATNSSEVIIANNISKGYAGVLLPGASADSASWLNIHSGSNVMVRGNLVSGYHNAITAAPVAGTRVIDFKIQGNVFQDITAIPLAIPALVNMVGNSALVERLSVSDNKFMNCPSVAVFLNASDSIIKDNEFFDCNLTANPAGVICIGYPQAGISTNSTNISIVGNKLVSLAANAGPGIVIYGMSHSNTVHGNEISRKYATNIHDLGVGTRTRPVNLVAPGSLLRSDALGDERAVTIGANLTWDGTTLAGTGGGGGGGAGSLAVNDNQFVTNSLLNIKSGALLTNLNIKAASGASLAMVVETNVFGVSNGTVRVGGHTIFLPDNTYDIGASAATRPRTLYLAGGVIAGGSLRTGSGSLEVGASGFIIGTASGILKLSDINNTDFTRLQFGGTTEAFPAIGRTNGDVMILGANGAFSAVATNRLHVPGGIVLTNANVAAGKVWTAVGTLGGGTWSNTPAGGGGISGIIAGNSNQIPYLDHTGTNYTYGAGALSSLTNAGFGFRPTGPNGGYGGLEVWADAPMGLLTVGHPNPASDFGTPAVALVVSNRYNGAGFKQELIKIDGVDIGSGSDPTSTLMTFRNWAGTTPTIVAEVRKDGLITSVAGFQNSPAPGSSHAALTLFETNQSKAITISAPPVLVSNINLTLPAGISNGYMRVTSVNDSNFNVTFETPAISLLVAPGNAHYTLTTTITNVNFGTSELTNVLASAGTYLVLCSTMFLGDAAGTGDQPLLQLWCSDGIVGDVKFETQNTASEYKSFQFATTVTITGARTVWLQAKNSSARGVIVRDSTSLRTVKLF